MKNFIAVFIYLLVFDTFGQSPIIRKTIKIDIQQKKQVIRGFGTNLNPRNWKNGKLKPVLDSLIDDLGCTLFRVDAWGDADWLDPKMQQNNGFFSDGYLTKIYTQNEFEATWQMCRYLNSKNVEIIFNVSGHVPEAWQNPVTKELNRFDLYAKMLYSLLNWARNHENIKFHYCMPFNEMDLKDNIEGPSLSTNQQRLELWKTVYNELNNNGFSDLDYILFCDSGFDVNKFAPLLDKPDLMKNVIALSGHTYGNGSEGDGGWFLDTYNIGQTSNLLHQKGYNSTQVWLSEYGDLDQTNEIEWEIAWRMNRRLMRGLSENLNAALTWDAYDNYHKHDSTWASYGLFATNSSMKKYAAKKRYFASKHFFKTIKSGYQQVKIEPVTMQKPSDIFWPWQNPLKNLNIQAYISPNKNELVIVAMNTIEKPVELDIDFSSFGNALHGVDHRFTTETQNYKINKNTKFKNGKLTLTFLPKSINSIILQK